ncbi:unnamed protein product [Adineta ricciae]|uniref:Uncharacterized protein n=1 Tax=Adineta ricciae TaxID=249248 RepID=A0A813UAD2_ADIRI|nr:unnamed protein product [Adineta ricciae]CAF1149084.1 unnamed protein product [Adineta ricciae]
MDIMEGNNSDTFYINATRHLVHIQDGRHAEWVLFRQGSLFIQNILNNEETPLIELVNEAKQDKTNYYISLYSFPGVVLVHPSQQITDVSQAIISERLNILNNQENPAVIAIGNTKKRY